MNDCLVDSSAWIEYFKGNEAYSFVTDLIYGNLICVNEIVLTELLPSIIHRKENKLAELLSSARRKTLMIDWPEIRKIQLLNLKHGNNNVGVSDIIIAQNCMQNDLTIITCDKHFASMAKYVPLKLYKPIGSS
jgi:predicted nucleic acid-binding protein